MLEGDSFEQSEKVQEREKERDRERERERRRERENETERETREREREKETEKRLERDRVRDKEINISDEHRPHVPDEHGVPDRNRRRLDAEERRNSSTRYV